MESEEDLQQPQSECEGSPKAQVHEFVGEQVCVCVCVCVFQQHFEFVKGKSVRFDSSLIGFCLTNQTKDNGTRGYSILARETEEINGILIKREI